MEAGEEIKNLIDYCQDRGGLNLSDIARWLDEHLPTVREWVLNCREPRKPRRAQVLARMRELRRLIDKRKGALIPNNTKQHERARAIIELRNATFGLPKESATG